MKGGHPLPSHHADKPHLSSMTMDGGVQDVVDSHASKYYVEVIGSHQTLTLK